MAGVELKSCAFRQARENSWHELDELVSRCESEGCERLTTEELLQLPHLYRGAASSLSVARSISLDRSVTLFLESLVHRAYFLLYGARLRSLRELAGYLVAELPIAVRQSRRELWLSVAIFLLAALLGGMVTTREPGYFFALAPDDVRGVVASSPFGTESLSSGDLWPRHGSADVVRRVAEFPFNETAITPFVVAAGGVAFGLPTVVLLMYAGVEVGAVAAVFFSRDLGVAFLLWAIATGVLQWFGLWLCASAGFSLAEPIVFPPVGGRTRALRMKGWSAGILVVGGLGLILIGRATLWIVDITVRDPALKVLVCFFISMGWLLFLFRRNP